MHDFKVASSKNAKFHGNFTENKTRSSSTAETVHDVQTFKVICCHANRHSILISTR